MWRVCIAISDEKEILVYTQVGKLVITGVMLLTGYDLFRIMRRILRHPAWTLALEDYLYWLVFGFFVSARLYCLN